MHGGFPQSGTGVPQGLPHGGWPCRAVLYPSGQPLWRPWQLLSPLARPARPRRLQHAGMLSTASSHLKQPGMLQSAVAGAQAGRGLQGLSYFLGAARGPARHRVIFPRQSARLWANEGLSSSGVLGQLSCMGLALRGREDGVGSSAPQRCGAAAPCPALPAPIWSGPAEPAVPALTQAPTPAQQGDPSGTQVALTALNILRN